MQRLKDSYVKQYAPAPAPKPVPFIPRKSNTGIIVGGENNIDVKLSKCCNPLPGEDIIGFITKGHGVSIHRKDCSKYTEAVANGTEHERWVEVTWAENAGKSDNPIFKATLDIVSYNSFTLLANVTAVTAEMRIPVSEITSKNLKNGNANIIITCSIAGVQQLNLLISKLRKIPDVISAERIVN